MAKKKNDTEQSMTTAETAPAPSPFLNKLMAAGEKKFGEKGVFVGAATRVIGLEPYSLALQYLMDLQVVPLQSIITIAGEPKTYKTSTLLEFCKMAMQLQPTPGVGVIANTEGKWSDSKVSSMLGPLSDQFILHQASSIEDWQATATHYLSTMKDIIERKKEAQSSRKKNEYSDMVIPPMIFGVDSLTGSQSDKVQEGVLKEGHGSKTYQDRALINWQWFNTWGSNLVGLPVTVIISQHLKDKIDGMGGMPTKVTGGGTGAGFLCSMEIRVQNGGSIDKASHEGAYLYWKMHFNSLGRDKRKIKIPYIETYDEQDRQVAYFDWDEALVHLLLEIMGEGGPLKDRVKETVGNIVEYSKPGFGKVYTCDALGITRDNAMENGITATVLGKELQKTGSDMRAKLQKALRIQPAQVWTPESF